VIEAILFHLIGGPDRKIPSNTHFDTARGNIEATGAEAIDLPAPEGLDPTTPHPFKGNIDLKRLETFLKEHGLAVPCVMITVTNNAGGGQPASLQNIRAAAARWRIASASRSSSMDAASPRTPGSSGSASRGRAGARSSTSCATCSPTPTA
jgi:tryptophanase